MKKKLIMFLALVCLASFAYADDTNATIPTNIPQSDLGFIVDILSALMRGIWDFIAWVFIGITQAIMALGLNEFQAELAIAMLILAFSAWKAGSIGMLLDKVRWIVMFIVALVLIGIMIGVIV